MYSTHSFHHGSLLFGKVILFCFRHRTLLPHRIAGLTVFVYSPLKLSWKRCHTVTCQMFELTESNLTHPIPPRYVDCYCFTSTHDFLLQSLKYSIYISCKQYFLMTVRSSFLLHHIYCESIYHIVHITALAFILKL